MLMLSKDNHRIGIHAILLTYGNFKDGAEFLRTMNKITAQDR